MEHPLCAPRCEALSVHYMHAGYEVIAGLIWSGVTQHQMEAVASTS